jgi:hypothetical protein
MRQLQNSCMFKRKTLIPASAIILLILCSSTQYSSAPPSGYTGVNGSTCASCHGGFPINSAGGGVVVTGLPTGSYVPGQSYPISVTVSHSASDRARWGFALAAKNALGQAAGTFTTTNPNTTLIGSTEIGHNSAVVTSLSSSYTYTGMSWTAPLNPSANDLNLKFYSVGVAANNNGGSSGDYVYSSLINSSFTVLPVLLTSFSANVENNSNVILKWKTANEQNSDFFLIERSQDGQTFTAIDRVAAAGNSGLPRNYIFTDKNPKVGRQSKIVYRLKQVDKDQNYFYSEIVSVRLTTSKIFMEALTPNVIRTSESTIVRVSVPSPTLFNIILTDVTGKKVFSTRYYAQDGYNSIAIPSSAYNNASGTYFIYIQSGDFRQTERLIVQ